METKPDLGVKRATTRAVDAAQAADELKTILGPQCPDCVLLFSSADRDLDGLAQALSQRFGPIPVVGCTTSGEIAETGYLDDGIVALALAAPDFHVAAERIDNLSSFNIADGSELVRRGLRRLERAAPHLNRSNIFSLLLIDGLSRAEEAVVSSLHGVLGEIPLFGGSAGDNLRFKATHILHDGAFRENCAVLVLIATPHPFRVFKTEHFTNAEEKMVVTEADPARRIVTEINAEPAAREYARVVGLSLDELTPMIFAAHPVLVRVGGLNFVRSIQKVNDDESLTFFCAIDEGIVLTVAKAQDIACDLERQFASLRHELGPLQLVIGCDCILRLLEIKQRGLSPRMGDILAANKVFGFSTFGEQFQAMHVNQTFTGVAIGRSSPP